MARFVSQYRGYTISVRPGKPEVQNFEGRVIREAEADLEAKFSHDLMDEEAIKIAKLDVTEGGLAQLKPGADGRMKPPFHGTQQDETGRDLPIEIRLSLFDSEIAALQNGWTVEDEALVVKSLRESNLNGTYFVEVVPTAAAKPWNGYDDTDPERILEISDLIGADLEAVLAYEKANQNRISVIGDLADAISTLDETEVVVSA